MIDVHSHIVFEVDDGAKSKEQSLQILKEAYDAGFEKIIATPHYMEEYYEIDKHEIKKRIDEIQEELSKAVRHPSGSCPYVHPSGTERLHQSPYGEAGGTGSGKGKQDHRKALRCRYEPGPESAVAKSEIFQVSGVRCQHSAAGT